MCRQKRFVGRKDKSHMRTQGGESLPVGDDAYIVPFRNTFITCFAGRCGHPPLQLLQTLICHRWMRCRNQAYGQNSNSLSRFAPAPLKEEPFFSLPRKCADKSGLSEGVGIKSKRIARGALAPSPSSFLFGKEMTVENDYQKGFSDISLVSDIKRLQRLKLFCKGLSISKDDVCTSDWTSVLPISETLFWENGRINQPPFQAMEVL